MHDFFTNYFSYGSFPGAVINREHDVDPYNGLEGISLSDIVAYTLNESCQADLQAEAYWANEEKTLLDITATTTFYYSTDRSDYALAFVVVHDSLRGSGADWAQVNIYSGSAEWAAKPYMKQFTDAPGTIEGYAYNHVAIAAQGILKGVNGSIVAPIVDGEAQTFTTTVDLTGNSLLQNPDHVHGVVMLIYRPTGLVVNAAPARLPVPVEDAISVASDRQYSPAGYYTADGRRTSTQRLGLNIVRMTDGTIRKVVYKVTLFVPLGNRPKVLSLGKSKKKKVFLWFFSRLLVPLHHDYARPTERRARQSRQAEVLPAHRRAAGGA